MAASVNKSNDESNSTSAEHKTTNTNINEDQSFFQAL